MKRKLDEAGRVEAVVFGEGQPWEITLVQPDPARRTFAGPFPEPNGRVVFAANITTDEGKRAVVDFLVRRVGLTEEHARACVGWPEHHS